MRRRPLLRLSSAEDTWRALEGYGAAPADTRMQGAMPASAQRGMSPSRRYNLAAEGHRRQQPLQLTADVQLGTTGMLKFELPHHAEDRIRSERAQRWAAARGRTEASATPATSLHG